MKYNSTTALILLLFATTSFAETISLSVSRGELQYKIQKDEKKLEYTSPHYSRVFNIRKCNELMIKTFLSELSTQKRKGFSIPNAKDVVTVIEPNSKIQYSVSSPYGKFLIGIPERIINLAIRDESRCKKEK